MPQKENDHAASILRGWLDGKTGSSLSKLDEDAMSFIEDAVVYRLTWGVEAVRLMAVAEEDPRFDDEPSPALSRIEFGLFSETALWFRQLGIESRLTCAALVPWFSPPLESKEQASLWLLGENAREMSDDASFPSVATHSIFVNFFSKLERESHQRARLRIFEIDVSNYSAAFDGQPLVAKSTGGRDWKIFTSDLLEIGKGRSRKSGSIGTTAYAVAGNTPQISFWVWTNA